VKCDYTLPNDDLFNDGLFWNYLALQALADSDLQDNLQEMNMGRGVLLWMLGIPIPIILVIWLFGGLHG
jgi:hypothetical protein